MHQTYKAGQWHFGMTAHIGVDSATGLIHSASVKAANEHDSQQLGNLTSTATKPGFIATAPTGVSRTRSKPNRPSLKTPPTSVLTATHRLGSGTKGLTPPKAGYVPRSSIRLPRSSASGALPGCGVGGWPRMQTVRLPCWRCSISTSSSSRWGLSGNRCARSAGLAA